MGNVERKGAWTLPTQFRVFALLGNVELDLASVRLGPGTSHIEVISILGNVEIRVPPGIRLECEGEPFMGNFELKGNAESTLSPDAPLVRITASAYLASVEIKVVDPNAPSFFQKLRTRLSRVGAGPNAGQDRAV